MHRRDGGDLLLLRQARGRCVKRLQRAVDYLGDEFLEGGIVRGVFGPARHFLDRSVDSLVAEESCDDRMPDMETADVSVDELDDRALARAQVAK